MMGSALVAALAASVALSGGAQAETTIPGLNGKILFSSDRDFPVVPELGSRGGESCDRVFCNNEIYTMNADGGGQTRITNNQSDDDEGAWLPADGAQIAFESDRTATGGPCTDTCDLNIWSMVNDGSSPVELTTDAGDEFHPSYSPDGTRIAFAGENPALAPTAGDRAFDIESLLQEPTEIFTMPAGGESAGAATPLLPAGQTGAIDATTDAVDSYPSWSPDGTKIAFTRLSVTFEPSGSGERLGPVPQSLDIRTYIAPASGGGPATPVETYPACSTAALAPDEARTAVNSIARVLVGGGARALSTREISTFDCTFDIDPKWSPDGSTLAVTRVTTGDFGNELSSDRLIVFPTGDEGDIVTIPVANPAGEVDLSKVTEPADCNTGPDAPVCSMDEDPAWSPDGTKIVFDSDRQANGTQSDACVNGDADCYLQVWVMNADGTAGTQLTSDGDNFDPDWQRIPPPPPPPAPVIPAAPPAPPAAPATAPKIGVAGVRRACVRGSFHVRFRVATTSSVKSVVVRLDGHRIKSTKRGGFTLRINGHRLKAGRHRLTITATNAAGKRRTVHKSFSVCRAAKKRHHAAPRFTG